MNTPVFPTRSVSQSDLFNASNNYASTLTIGITSTDTTLHVASTSGFSAPGLVSINGEIIAIYAVASGTTLTVGHSAGPSVDGRGYDGSTAASHLAGQPVQGRIAAWMHNQLAAETIKIESTLLPATTAPAGSIGLQGSVYGFEALVADQAGGVDMGGSLAMAAAPVASGTAYTISNWYYGPIHSVVNTIGTAVTWVSGMGFGTLSGGGTVVINGVTCVVATYTDIHHFTVTVSQGNQTNAVLTGTDYNDRLARDGASVLMSFGSNQTDGNPDAFAGELRISGSQTGLAGDHIVWAQKFSFYGNGYPVWTSGAVPYPTVQGMGWFSPVGGAQGGLYVQTDNTIATGGPTALNTALVPGTPSKSVLTGNESTLALEISFDSSGNAYLQPRDFAGDSTPHNTLLNYLGGKVGIGKSPTHTLDVAGDVSGVGVITSKDDATSVPSQLGVFGASNSNQQLLLGYNTTSDYGSIQAIKQSSGTKPLLLNPIAGGVGINFPGSSLPLPAPLTVNGNSINITTASTPASAAATGVAGTISWDANYIYVCVAANTWKRVAIATW